jgi:YegS/Rv2252/BmrU family lipid kinase
MKAAVVYNPAAGREAGRERRLDRALSAFLAEGWNPEVWRTGAQGHAAELTKTAVEQGFQAVVAAGGDGTVNEVVQSLAHTPTRLGVLPLGTVNVWAREAGFSTRPDRAARQLAHGETVTVDLGRVASRYFLLMAGVGFDAEVTAVLGTAQLRKQKLGVLPYLARLATVLPRYRGASIEIETDGRIDRHEALMVLVANTRLYAGIRRPIRGAVANDGLLDIRLFRGRSAADGVRHLAAFLLDRQGSDEAGELMRAERLVVRADPPMAVQVDGDPVGLTPIEISVEQHALRAIVSPNYDASLTPARHA